MRRRLPDAVPGEEALLQQACGVSLLAGEAGQLQRCQTRRPLIHKAGEESASIPDDLNYTFGQGTGAQSPTSGLLHMPWT